MSECALWRLQEEYYDSLSLDAWLEVPVYPTSRMKFAATNARQVLFFLLDIVDQLDLESTVYLVELGGGSGGFAFRFLNEFVSMRHQFPQLKDLKFKYVLTDFTMANVTAHLKNLRLRSYFEEGLLDVAVFSPQDSDSLTLEFEKLKLEPGALKNPLLVAANYFFDTIKHDAFKIERNELFETQFNTFRDPSSLDMKLNIKNARMEESFQKIQLPYYADGVLDSILEYYRTNYEEASIIFPVGAFRCLQNLEKLASDRLAVFAWDKGFASLESWVFRLQHKTVWAVHGSFSFDVNFDALQRYFTAKKGFAVTAGGDHVSLAGLIGTTISGTFPMTNCYFHMHTSVEDSCNSSFNLEEVIFSGLATEEAFARSILVIFRSLVQQYNYDPRIFDNAFCNLRDKMLADIANLDAERRRECLDLATRTYANIFNFAANDFSDFASVSEFCLLIGEPQAALDMALDALATLGEFRRGYDFAAMACEAMDRKAEAHAYFLQSLDLEPTHEWSREGAERTST